jgi:cation diffusion facilitator family transporter
MPSEKKNELQHKKTVQPTVDPDADGTGTADAPVSESVSSRDSQIVKTSAVGIVANVLLAVFKAAVGLLSNSIAIVLDAVNNLSDAASSVITIVGTKLAGKQADKKHPYGHGRIEYLTTIIIAVIVLWAGVTSLQESISRIVSPEAASYDNVTLIIVAVGVVAKIVLGLYTKRKGQEYSSGSLVASGTDALMDSIISAATLVAAFIFIFTGVSLEAWLGAIISLVIIKAGIDMLREMFSKLIGERVESDTAKAVKQTVASVDGVHGAYDLIMEDYGPDRLWGSIHIEVDDTMTAAEIDKLTREIQQKVYLQNNVLIHTVGIYSCNTQDDAAVEMRSFVFDLAEANEYVMQLHGFYVDEETHQVSFDLVVSFDAPDRRGVVDRIRSIVERRYPDYHFQIALDSDISD